MRHRTIHTAVLLGIVAFWSTGCQRSSATTSGVKSVAARIDGITCPTCVPPLHASLKRLYANAAIDVDDDKDTATIRFAENESFSAAEFRAAVERVRMHVVTIRMQACGSLEASNGSTWLTAGHSRFLVRSDRELPSTGSVCADGTLDARSDPATFQISAFSVQGS